MREYRSFNARGDNKRGGKRRGVPCSPLPPTLSFIHMFQLWLSISYLQTPHVEKTERERAEEKQV